MSKKPLTLSIVIPAYNEERYLPACLKSLSKQTVKPDEVIIIDNNSTDKTADVASRFRFAQVIKEPQQGIVFARDKGFNAAKGQIIGRIDADAVLPPDWVKQIKLHYALAQNHGTALTGGPSFIDIKFQRLAGFSYRFLVFTINRLLIGYPSLWGSSMAITKDQWNAIKTRTCRRVDIHEDLDLAMHLHGAGFRIIYYRKLKVNAHLRRLALPSKELWSYLMWWPRNLRIHNKKTWPLCWLICASTFVTAMFLRKIIYRL